MPHPLKTVSNTIAQTRRKSGAWSNEKIPTLGYPSRTDAVIALTLEGLKPGAIAKRTGLPVASVYGLVNAARKVGRLPESVSVTLPQDVADELRDAARAQGMGLPSFVARLLTTIAREDLLRAVLDDEDA